MVIPLGGMGPGGGGGGGLGAGMDQPTPAAVKERWSPWWWALLFVFLLVGIMRMVASDILGGLISLIMTYFCFYIVKNDCSNMSQPCLFLFGFLCLMNGLMELITVLMVAGGRSEQKVTPLADASSKSTTSYVITIEKHPLFDPSAGFLYNLQSAMMIASPCSALLGALLCWLSYNTYTNSMFEAPEEQQGGFAGGGFGGGYGANAAGGNAGGYRPTTTSGGTAFTGTGQRLGGGSGNGQGNSLRLFEGEGQTLGSA